MDIKLPKLGEGVDSGTVVTVLVKEGDQIRIDQPLIELETEKAVGTIPAPAAGTVGKIHVRVGDKIAVGGRIVTIQESGKNAGQPAPARPAAAATPPPVASSGGEPAPAQRQPARPIPGVTPPAPPSIRKLAQELGIDLSQVAGSEAGGRITTADLRAYIQQLQQLARQSAGPAERPGATAPVPIDFSQWGPVVKQPMSATRRTISRRLHESWSAIPHVTQFDEADITGLMDLRAKYGTAYEAKGARLTLTVFALPAVVGVLKRHGLFNSSLDEAAGEIILKDYYHLGVAVNTDHGLVAPVIRQVDQKPMLVLARELEQMAEKARQRKLTVEEMRGGTFTISNQGGIGGGAFTPIINRPEVAILGLGRAVVRPVVRDGRIEPRRMLPLGLSYDHRVIDGADAAQFVVDLVKAFQEFPEDAVKF